MELQKADFDGSLCWFDSISTTQEAAPTLLKSHPTHSVAVAVAGSQTQGRGRSGRQWISAENGNLYMSIAIKSLKLNNWSVFPILLAVAVAKAVKLADLPTLNYKWPNDLLLNSKKCGGILIERTLNGTADTSIIGVGLNVYFTPIVPDITPTSIADENLLHSLGLDLQSPTCAYKNTKEVMLSLANKITVEVLRCVNDINTNNSKALAEWRQKAWKQSGDTIAIKVGKEHKVDGKYLHIEDDGALVLQVSNADGTISEKRFQYGDVTV